MLVDSRVIYCPYCGEPIDILVDTSVESQSYIEDCSVCCRPIEMSVFVTDDTIELIARRDDE